MENQDQQLITDQQILEVSLKIEREGQAFYKELAEHIEDPTIKSFLSQMSKEEAQHEIHFKAILKRKGGKLYGWENQKELHDFLDQFQTDIFPKLDEILDDSSKMASLQKAVDFAREAEKVSVEFYSLLGEYCEDLETKTALLLLEQAERDHLNYIEALRKNLTQ